MEFPHLVPDSGPGSGPPRRAVAGEGPQPRQWRSHLAPLSMPHEPPAPRAVSAAATPDDLAELLRAVAQQQDRVAFAGLFRHFAPRIKAYLLRGGVAPGLAEELAQEAMVQVWRKAASFDPAKARASTWIFTIARNLRIDQLRRGGEALPGIEGYGGFAADEEGAGSGAPAVPELADDAPAPDEQIQRHRAERDVQAALAELPAEQREILRLSFFEEQPHAVIAQTLAIPLGTVKSRIRLAVGHLRRQLGHLMP